MIMLSKVLSALWFLSILLLCFLVIYDAIEESSGARIVLSGKKWECSSTKSKNKLVAVGAVMVPFANDECVAYKKI